MYQTREKMVGPRDAECTRTRLGFVLCLTGCYFLHYSEGQLHFCVALKEAHLLQPYFLQIRTCGMTSEKMAGPTGFEPATSRLTIWRPNQLNDGPSRFFYTADGRNDKTIDRSTDQPFKSRNQKW